MSKENDMLGSLTYKKMFVYTFIISHLGLFTFGGLTIFIMNMHRLFSIIDLKGYAFAIISYVLVGALSLLSIALNLKYTKLMINKE